MKRFNQLILGLLISASTISSAQTTIYTNDMDYVLGDVKQAFIQDKLKTSIEIENLLTGFKAMKVNGIRVPIFPEGLIPDEPAIQYFIKRAVQEGFKIFANPAQCGGGKHIANQAFGGNGDMTDDKVQILINRILDFDKKNPECTWINPFNEDGKTNNPWSAAQMNTIYKALSEGLENAELIGSCAWGLPASIDILKNTNIEDYITISTSHNLGFNHSSWTTFINLSHAAGLQVWDSEVNHNKKYETKSTRLEAAIQYGVDGLVLYDSDGAIDWETGAIKSNAETWMSFYLKPAALEEISKNESFANIYQISNGFHIGFITPGKYNVSITDISGKQVRNYSNISANSLQIENLESGMYVVLLSSENNRQVEKVIVH